MPSPEESYRATMRVMTPEHGRSTLIVLRRGLSDPRVWLSLHGAIQTTTVLTRAEVAELQALLDAAAGGTP